MLGSLPFRNRFHLGKWVYSNSKISGKGEPQIHVRHCQYWWHERLTNSVSKSINSPSKYACPAHWGWRWDHSHRQFWQTNGVNAFRWQVAKAMSLHITNPVGPSNWDHDFIDSSRFHRPMLRHNVFLPIADTGTDDATLPSSIMQVNAQEVTGKMVTLMNQSVILPSHIGDDAIR